MIGVASGSTDFFLLAGGITLLLILFNLRKELQHEYQV
jgi:hypothetical protein